jgi:RHS repeat-associated protein
MRTQLNKTRMARFAVWMVLGAVGLVGIVRSGAPTVAPASNAATQFSVYPPRVDSMKSAGGTATPLPDGNWLLVGGTRDGEVTNAISVVPSGQTPSNGSPSGLSLEFARAGHTATVLPNGSVFIFGGEGPDGELVSQAEVIDVSAGTVSPIASDGLTLRTSHTATLLTDGRVLIVGGIGSDGSSLTSVQIWDPSTGGVAVPLTSLATGRYGQEAMLLADGGAVLIQGGQLNQAQPALQSELYDPLMNSIEPAPQSVVAQSNLGGQLPGAPAVVASLPAGDAVGVSIDGALALRFDRPLRIDQLNVSTVTLVGPGGAVSGQVVGAEGGKLVFFTPTIDLTPATTYTLFIAGVNDTAGAALPFTSIRFTTRRLDASGTDQAHLIGAGARSKSPGNTSTVQPTLLQPTTPQKTSSPPVANRKAAPPSPEAEDAGSEDWIPSEQNRHGQWRVLGLANDPAIAPLPKTAPRLSAAGQTAVTGQILRYNGRPLVGAAVSIGPQSTVTDETGRFLLNGVPSGLSDLKVDGTGVIVNGRHYTKHFIQVTLSKGTTTSLADPIFLPRVDPATEVSISSPANKEVVLTHPAIPGLEVHIPKGVVLREYDGKIVTRLSITPIPLDRPPYPTPVPFSVYFTLQPGGAYVDGDPSKSIKIIYPNYQGLPPASHVDFWNYDPSNGWKVYGQGVVSKDGKKVVPQAGLGFRQIMSFGFGIGSSTDPPASAPPAGGCVNGGDPVDCATGFFTHAETDMSIRDTVPISVTRTYMSNDPTSRAFGIGTNLSYSMHLYTAETTNPLQDIYLILPDGGRVHYALQSTSPNIWTNLDSPTAFYGSTMQYAQTPHDLITVTLANHTVLNFISDVPNQLSSIVDSNGNTVSITLSGGRSGNISQVTSPNSRYIQFAYDSSNRITTATDNLGRTVSYSYDSAGRLYQVTDEAGHVETYGYDSSNRMTTVTDKRQNTMVTNVYNSSNQVTKQTLADGSVWQFAYTTSGGDALTTVTDPRNNQRQDTFNASGYLTQEVLAVGRPEQQTYVLQRNTGNLVTSITDPLNRVTTYSYNAVGEPTSITQLSGTANAVTGSFTYDPVFQQLASYSDPLGHTTQWSYDSSGNLNEVTNALNNSWTIANNGQGLPESITDPLSHAMQLGYVGGDLSTVTDALGRTSTVFTDSAGRLISAADALGNTYQYAYDPRDNVSSITDPVGGVTSMTYDANGNLLTVQDPRNVGTHMFSYDVRNRVKTYTDPLGNIETYNYDGMGNLVSKIDRKNQTTSYSYDGLNRVTGIAYADNSSITVTWDAGNRATLFADTTNGTISRQYDGLDRLTQEVSPQGQVNYAYDAANRRSRLTVSGLSAVTYQYDNANRLTQIAQGAVTVGMGYDAANRRISVSLPNGILGAATYDNASELTALSYNNGTVSIGSLAYTYDQAGRRIGQSGSLATPMFPPSVATASYNSANQLTSWGSSSLAYDKNGNLTAAGSSTYSWNARDQLIATSDGGGGFTYDPLGRRVSATISGTTTPYLYDGLNAATVAGSLMLDGPGLDEIYARVNGTAVTSFLTDALGSTLALTNSTAATTATYAYSPYGTTSSTGTAGTPFQFTGRENDGATNLYYYRARYYSPTLNRFISQDPLGLAGGVNTYAYAGGNPVSNTDPLGLFLTSVDAACVADPNFCAEIMGQIVHNAAAISGDPCTQEAADAVGGALNTVASIAAIVPLWKSVKQFGHTFTGHGSGARMTQNLAGEAAGVGEPRGQWLNNVDAANFLSSLELDGAASVRIPEGLGQVVNPDGSIVPAVWAYVLPFTRGSGIRTAYPIVP